MDIGTAVSRRQGISEEKIRALGNFRSSTLFSAQEKAVLEYADAMTETPVEVGDALFQQLGESFNNEQLVELTSTIAWENYRARFDHAFGVESANFTQGAYCALPVRDAHQALSREQVT